jgi:hypothetical protein
MSLGGAPSAPTPPDPAATSAAQTQSNKETALYNYGLNNPNYNTPLGSLSTSVDTSNPNQPKSTSNITLSPDQQTLLDNQSQQSIGLSNLANQLQGRVGTSLDQPLPSQTDINSISKNASDAYYKNETQYLDPQWNNTQQQLAAQLANQGITQGSEAYNNAHDEYGRQKQQAYTNATNNAITQGPANAQQLFALTSEQRGQPLNELNALRTGSQVSMPTLPGQTPSNAAPTDVSGNINNAYNQQLGIYNSQLAGQNSLSSGLFGLGGSLGAAGLMKYCDRRLKTNIERIGETKGGVPVYRYKYRGSDHVHMGVMSDEVKHIPGAVVRMPGGFDAVDYSRIR